MTTIIPSSDNTTAGSDNDDNDSSSSSSSLHQLLIAPIVDWRHFEERLENHPDEARILNAQGWSVLQVLLAKRPNVAVDAVDDVVVIAEDSACSSPKRQRRILIEEHASPSPPSPPPPPPHLPLPSRLVQLVERLIFIFPEAAWLGIDSYTSPLHLACRFNPTSSPLLLQVLLHARPTVLPFDQKALVYLWDYHVQSPYWVGNGNPDLVVATLSNHIKYKRAHSMEGYIGDSIKMPLCDNGNCHHQTTIAYQQLVTVLYYISATGDNNNKNDHHVHMEKGGNDDEDYYYHHDPWYDDQHDDYYVHENHDQTTTTTPKCCWTRVVNPCFLNDGTFLHRVASLTTDLDFMRFALVSSSSSNDKDAAAAAAAAHESDVDCYNRLPMHCFLSNPPHARGPPNDFDCFYDLIPLFDVLYQANPQALQTTDALGMLPLHIAIQNSWSEQLIMDRLLYHYPESLECPVTVHVNNNSNPDNDNNNNKQQMQAITVLPFQLAALTPTTSLTTVYRLVRQDPRIAVDAFRCNSSTPSHSLIATVPPQSSAMTPLPSSSSTRALCQFVKAVGEQHNVRLWRTMNVLLTTPCNDNNSNTFMSALAPAAAAAVLRVLPEEEENDRFNSLQHYLLTIASLR